MSPEVRGRRYVNHIPRRERLKRLAWEITYWLLFRPTPRWALHRWRLFLLRCYGARIGRGSKVAPTCRVFAPWKLIIGEFTALADRVDCYCVDEIQIGSMSAVSQRAFLCTASHDIGNLDRPMISKPIVLGDHVWVCAEAYVAPGVTLGDGVVVGARASVFKDIEPWVVVGAAPGVVLSPRRIRQSYVTEDRDPAA